MLNFALGIEDPLFVQPVNAGADFDEMIKSITAGMPKFRAERPDSQHPFIWNADLATTSGITLLRARYGASWTYTPQTEDESLVLRFCGAGTVETSIKGEKITSSPGTAILASCADIGRTTVMIDADDSKLAASATFVFSAPFVKTCLRGMVKGGTLHKVGLMPLLDLRSPHGQTLTALCRTLAQGMIGERLLERSPKATVLLGEALIRLVLEHHPHRLSESINNRLPHVVPRHVKKAIDFMHANMHRPITLSDIAAASEVNERTLQIGFKKFRETTPLLYLRQVRLEAVRAELSAAENNLPIREVAFKWGFSHMGRFAAEYKAAFGEAPSVTVQFAK